MKTLNDWRTMAETLTDSKLMQALQTIEIEQAGGFGHMVDHSDQEDAYWDEAQKRGLVD